MQCSAKLQPQRISCLDTVFELNIRDHVILNVSLEVLHLSQALLENVTIHFKARRTGNPQLFKWQSPLVHGWSRGYGTGCHCGSKHLQKPWVSQWSAWIRCLPQSWNKNLSWVHPPQFTYQKAQERAAQLRSINSINILIFTISAQKEQEFPY